MQKKILSALRNALPDNDVNAVEQCVTNLHDRLPHKENLSKNKVMVAYGGGKDSAYTTAFMRAVHLAMAERFGGDTFRLVIVTMRHSGMPFVVMQNIDRTYRTLGVYDDPMAELLLIEGEEVRPFDLHAPMPHTLINFNRTDLLMSGHQSYGDGRTSFCNACNFNVANFFGVAARHCGVDLIVTGDSPSEQRDYAQWIHKLARQTGQKPAGDTSFKGTLKVLDGISRAYFTEIHGASHADRLADRRVTWDVSETLSFFSIYDYTDYASGAHWSLLTDFLGFVFDDLAFSFTESDCANPAMMAHLRGLRTERVYKRSYREGIDQYADFAIDLMKHKDFPGHLIDTIKKRYATEGGVATMRRLMETYARTTFGLKTEQLVCMVFSPFAGGCAGLHDYLAAEQPDLLPREAKICALLETGHIEDQGLAFKLERLSGLSLTDLRQLFGAPLWSPLGSDSEQGPLLPFITKSDPNQKLIRVNFGNDDAPVMDRVSGR
ncbi:PqqD family protein [Desulfoluna spongiiphila]|uniref:PqqD family protein n=1 Tax=Desulfoluna spongiiphila TaxID=419481 RepID=UPI0012520AFB|nr:PqqD family protein [Desulfoluna spongiiphila]VVS93824.1 rossmann-like alpha/beta/alpha sandwich fold [Desulfoluna spongiiphila]